MSITTAETQTIAATLRSALETEADVVAAYLYGSVARNVHRPTPSGRPGRSTCPTSWSACGGRHRIATRR